MPVPDAVTTLPLSDVSWGMASLLCGLVKICKVMRLLTVMTKQEMYFDYIMICSFVSREKVLIRFLIEKTTTRNKNLKIKLREY